MARDQMEQWNDEARQRREERREQEKPPPIGPWDIIGAGGSLHPPDRPLEGSTRFPPPPGSSVSVRAIFVAVLCLAVSFVVSPFVVRFIMAKMGFPSDQPLGFVVMLAITIALFLMAIVGPWLAQTRRGGRASLVIAGAVAAYAYWG